VGVLPEGVRRGHVVAAGAVAGIPFTVALFVAELALPPRLVEPATVAIILAAAATGVIGYLLLRRGSRAGSSAPAVAPPQVS
jgi:NhaA family Na+:H+ antiporter